METIGDMLTRYEAWKQTLVKDDDILAGEPVFPSSRLAVRRVGGLLMRGLPVAEIRADYPFLRGEDLEFAVLYTRVIPRMGSPSDREAPAR